MAAMRACRGAVLPRTPVNQSSKKMGTKRPMAGETGAEPGFQPLNVGEFPDARITSSPTVRGWGLWASFTVI